MFSRSLIRTRNSLHSNYHASFPASQLHIPTVYDYETGLITMADFDLGLPDLYREEETYLAS